MPRIISDRCLGSSNFPRSWLAVSIVLSITLLTQVHNIHPIKFKGQKRLLIEQENKTQSWNYCTCKEILGWGSLSTSCIKRFTIFIAVRQYFSTFRSNTVSQNTCIFFLQINHSFTVLPNSLRGGGRALKEQLEISNPFSLTKHWFYSLSPQERICFRNWRLKTRPKEAL